MEIFRRFLQKKIRILETRFYIKLLFIKKSPFYRSGAKIILWICQVLMQPKQAKQYNDPISCWNYKIARDLGAW